MTLKVPSFLILGLAKFCNLLFFRDRVRNTGQISCRVCLEDFQTSITCILVCIFFRAQYVIIFRIKLVNWSASFQSYVYLKLFPSVLVPCPWTLSKFLFTYLIITEWSSAKKKVQKRSNLPPFWSTIRTSLSLVWNAYELWCRLRDMWLQAWLSSLVLLNRI